MAYSSGMLKERVSIVTPRAAEGRVGKTTQWAAGPTVWASVTWAKGVRALRRGELTAYETVMVRTRWLPTLTRYCRLVWKGRYFVIESLNADQQDNTIQITAREVPPFEINGTK